VVLVAVLITALFYLLDWNINIGVLG